MKAKPLLILVTLLAGGTFAWIQLAPRDHKPERVEAVVQPPDPIANTVTAPTQADTPQMIPTPDADPSRVVPPNVPIAARSPSNAPAQPSGTRTPRQEWQDPVARVALSLVGFDPEAEAYWFEAIHDGNLSDNEREDLMEDLNEEGFPDPSNLTWDDLPLIVRRLEIIEEVAPSADAFILEHLAEAYKDLLNMYARLVQR